jgi:hypothetical protein
MLANTVKHAPGIVHVVVGFSEHRDEWETESARPPLISFSNSFTCISAAGATLAATQTLLIQEEDRPNA